MHIMPIWEVQQHTDRLLG